MKKFINIKNFFAEFYNKCYNFINIMNKKIKIILANALIIFSIILLLEFVLFTREYLKWEDKTKQQNLYFNNTIKGFSLYNYITTLYETYITIFNSNIQINKNFFRPITSYSQDNKKEKLPIILLGCSFTYGDNLSETETFSYVLSKYSKREIYNLGLSARSPRTMLYLMRENFQFTKEKLLNNNLNFEYIIYTYIYDHKRRLYVNLIQNDIPYYKTIKKDNNKYLKFVHYNFLNKTFIFKNIMELVYKYKNKYNQKDIFDTFVIYMKEINKEIQSKFNINNKSPKFVILVYIEDGTEDWNVLKQDNILIINIKKDLNIDIDEEKYTLFDGHPSKEAWQAIVPALVKELNL